MSGRRIGNGDIFAWGRAIRAVVLLVGISLLFFFLLFPGEKERVEDLPSSPEEPPVSAEAATQPKPTEMADFNLARIRSATNEATLNETLESMALPELLKALEALNHPDESSSARPLKLRIFHRAAELNPEAAGKWAVEYLSGRERTDFLGNLAATWAGRDMDATIAWAKQLPDGDRVGAVSKIAYEATASDPRKALELARDLPEGQVRNEIITHIAGEWSAKSPEKIVEWAGQIRDEGLRQQVVSRVATAWADTNPASAAGLALNSLPAGKLQDDAVMGIVQRWVQSQPADAAAWVGQFPEGRLRDTATEEVMKLWSDKNPADAGKWLDSLPSGSSRDAAASAYVGKVLETSPEAAGQWALQIGDESARTSALLRVSASWLASDPEKAASWIRQAAISDELKDRLLSRKAP